MNVLQDCLFKIYRFMEENPSVGLLGPQMLSRDRKAARSCMRFPTLWNALCRAVALDKIFAGSRFWGGLLMSDFAHDRLMNVEVLNGWFWVVRRDALQRVGLLDEQFFIYGEDVDWCYRFHQNGWRVVFYPDAKAIHYGGASSAKSPARFYVEKQKANLQYWKKYHRGYEWFAYIATMLLNECLRLAGYSVVWLQPSSGKTPHSR